jgi:hypothetical protein
MSPKELTAFRIDPQVMEGLRQVKERTGLALSVQVHMALTTWLESQGIKRKAERPRAVTRKRS